MEEEKRPSTGPPEVHGSITLSESGWDRVWLPDLPWKVAIRTAMIDGSPRIIGICLDPDLDEDEAAARVPWRPVSTSRGGGTRTLRDLVVTAESLRSLPLARVYDVVRAAREERYLEVVEALQRVERKPGEPWSDDHYRLVAKVYEQAARVGRPALKAVQERWKVSRSMASKHVRGARERGFLAWPEKPGQQGTGHTSLHLEREGGDQ